MENLIFISAQPVDKYFLWQVEVQIVNFRKFNISSNMHVLIWFPEHRRSEIAAWEELNKKYPEVKFFYYKDKGVNLGLYIPQLRPHILKQHFESFPSLSENVFFYHDSDIIFNRLPDFKKLLEDDICWQSNTTHYLDYSYLRAKEQEGKIPEEESVRKMAEIGGITVDIIKSYDRKTGGAQCLLKGIDASFWEDVEKMCIDIRRAFYWGTRYSVNQNSFNHKYFTRTQSPEANENAGFQSWCADMWALNFSLWKRGKVTDITDELEFSWATDNIDTFYKKPIYHNAGATGTQPGVFYKGNFITESPFGKNIRVDERSACFPYVEIINSL